MKKTTLLRDRKTLKRLVEQYGKKDVLNFVRHLNESSVFDTIKNSAGPLSKDEYMNPLQYRLTLSDTSFTNKHLEDLVKICIYSYISNGAFRPGHEEKDFNAVVSAICRSDRDAYDFLYVVPTWDYYDGPDANDWGGRTITGIDNDGNEFEDDFYPLGSFLPDIFDHAYIVGVDEYKTEDGYYVDPQVNAYEDISSMLDDLREGKSISI